MSPVYDHAAATRDRLSVRPWMAVDGPGLLRVIEMQANIDSGWPPDYARGDNLLTWLGAPATLGRWVALMDDCPVGHVGIAPVHAGALHDLWRAALPREARSMAEICRLVVDPQLRRSGISAALTRKAVRATIEQGFMPVANALADRSPSLAMMTAAGWRVVGTTLSVLADRELVALIPPPKLIEAALARQR